MRLSCLGPRLLVAAALPSWVRLLTCTHKSIHTAPAPGFDGLLGHDSSPCYLAFPHPDQACYRHRKYHRQSPMGRLVRPVLNLRKIFLFGNEPSYDSGKLPTRLVE